MKQNENRSQTTKYSKVVDAQIQHVKCYKRISFLKDFLDILHKYCYNFLGRYEKVLSGG